MNVESDVYSWKNFSNLQKHRMTKIYIDNIEIDNINIWRINEENHSRSNYFKYKTILSSGEIEVIIRRICDLHLGKLDIFDMCCCKSCLQGKFDGTLIIKQPVAKRGKLFSQSIEMITLPDAYSLHVRGIFSPTVILHTEENDHKRKALGFVVEDLNPVNNCIRFMGDEVFPDYYTDIGDDSVSYETLDKFMQTY